jgi:hypothetical protein
LAAGELTAPGDLAEWSLHCFCLEARATPHAVVRADNNGRILFAARTGVALDELRRQGLAPLDSQLRLLETYGLLRQTGTTIETAFPILDPAATGMLRERIDAIEAAGRDALGATLPGVLLALDREGLGENAFALIFGHALDGLFWDHLRARDMLPPTGLTIEHPFWRGSFWASYPKRRLNAGTNELRRDGKAMVMVWTEATSGALSRLARADATGQWLAALPATGLGSSAPLPAAAALVPIVVPDGALSASCEILARAAAMLIPDLLACHRLVKDAGATADPRTAVVIVAHELIWTIMERVLDQQLVRIPDDPNRLVFVSLGRTNETPPHGETEAPPDIAERPLHRP